MKHFIFISLAVLLSACGSPNTSVPTENPETEKAQYSLDQAGEEFVKLARVTPFKDPRSIQIVSQGKFQTYAPA